MKKLLQQRTWTTQQEIEFIQTLKKDSLDNYYKAIPLRTNWGKINRDEVVNACIRLRMAK